MFQGQYVRLRAFEPADVQSDALFVNHPETARPHVPRHSVSRHHGG